MYQSTKYYGHDRGLSCCFRQWKANHSHCFLGHGYALAFKFVFESETLDEKTWCFDFGNLKPMKDWLDHMFDHTMLLASDDPYLEEIQEFVKRTGLFDIRVVTAVGCESVAKMTYDKMNLLLTEMKEGKNTRYPVNPDVRLVSVEVSEHVGNSALYIGQKMIPTEVYELATALAEIHSPAKSAAWQDYAWQAEEIIKLLKAQGVTLQVND